MVIVKAENARKDIPLVSIIAVCYNHAKYVVETLDSILFQTYENIELIIIDSNSPDNSVEIIEEWIDHNGVDCKFIKQKEPRNVCQNLNQGLTLANGEFYQGISCDDYLFTDKIEHQVRILLERKNVGIICGSAFKIDNNSKLTGGIYTEGHLIFNLIFHNQFAEALKKSAIICAPSVLIRKNVFNEVGPYDEQLGFEDWDYWIRVSKTKWKFYYEFKMYCYYRELQSSLWHNMTYTQFDSIIKFFLKHNLQNYKPVLMHYMKRFSSLTQKDYKKAKILLAKNEMRRSVLMIMLFRAGLKQKWVFRFDRLFYYFSQVIKLI